MSRRFLLVLALVAGHLVSRSVRVSAATPPAARELDADRDGYPDRAELSSEDDRRAFVESFVEVALRQATEVEPSFEPAQRDCAGLVRYAYREALKRHDAAFALRHPGLRRLPEVRAFHYPAVPLLGTRLFRVKGGATLRPEDFDEAPGAIALAEGSARRIEGPAAPGDLLLFRGESGAHLMIVARGGDEGRVVYHTGPHDQGPGEVRRVSMASLLAHPDPAWRPVAANPSFAGIYRFKILEGP